MSVITKTFLTPYGVNARYPLIKEGNTIGLTNENGEAITTITTTGIGVASPSTTLVTYSALSRQTSGVITIDLLPASVMATNGGSIGTDIEWSFIDPFFDSTGNLSMGARLIKSGPNPIQFFNGSFRLPTCYDPTEPTSVEILHTAFGSFTGTVTLRWTMQIMRTGVASSYRDIQITNDVTPGANCTPTPLVIDLPTSTFLGGDTIVFICTRNGFSPTDTYVNDFFVTGISMSFSITALI